jgi:hypothetical protein
MVLSLKNRIGATLPSTFYPLDRRLGGIENQSGSDVEEKNSSSCRESNAGLPVRRKYSHQLPVLRHSQSLLPVQGERLNFNIRIIQEVKLRFCVFSFQIEVFWVVTPCSVVVGYQRFRGPCCLHHYSTSP